MTTKSLVLLQSDPYEEKATTVMKPATEKQFVVIIFFERYYLMNQTIPLNIVYIMLIFLSNPHLLFYFLHNFIFFYV